MKKIIILILALAITSCAGTMTDIAQGKGSTLDTYGVPAEVLRRVAFDVVNNYGLLITHMSEGYIQAKHGMSLSSNGELVAVYITPIDAANQHWRVEVASVPVMKSQVFGPEWERLIIDKMQEILRGRS